MNKNLLPSDINELFMQKEKQSRGLGLSSFRLSWFYYKGSSTQ